MTTVLFLINGLGLGNSTRCHAVIQRLHHKGARVAVASSANGIWYFRDKPEVTVLHEQQALNYGANKGQISILRTLLGIPQILDQLADNSRALERVLDEVRPDVVVTDSDYTFRPMKRRGIPIVALNNADVVCRAYWSFADRPVSIAPQFFAIEQMDRLFHRLVPDLVLSPVLDHRDAIDEENCRHLGPLVRREYEPGATAKSTGRVVIMLSGSRFGTPIVLRRNPHPFIVDIVGRPAPADWVPQPGITYHGKVLNVAPLLAEADLVVVNGGFSAVSEAFYMRKPLVVVPVPRHAEQWLNARTIERLGVGVLASEADIEETTFRAISRIDEFRAAYGRLPAIANGAEAAAEAILALAGRAKP